MGQQTKLFQTKLPDARPLKKLLTQVDMNDPANSEAISNPHFRKNNCMASYVYVQTYPNTQFEIVYFNPLFEAK